MVLKGSVNMDCNVVENINILAKFLGTRDIDALNQEELFKRYGIHQVDVMVYLVVVFLKVAMF